jgi:hypothetical protein
MEVGGQHHASTNLSPRKKAFPIIQEAEWVLGSVSTGAENLAPTGIRTSNKKGRKMYLRIN